VNLLADETLRRRFDMQCVSCASHARRPFAPYEDEDTAWSSSAATSTCTQWLCL
jgi:hypothetical protein